MASPCLSQRVAAGGRTPPRPGFEVVVVMVVAYLNNARTTSMSSSAASVRLAFTQAHLSDSSIPPYGICRAEHRAFDGPESRRQAHVEGFEAQGPLDRDVWVALQKRRQRPPHNEDGMSTRSR